MFGCETEDPTFNYAYAEAINNAALSRPVRRETHTTPFLREGISYSQMNRDQRIQLEAEDPEPTWSSTTARR